MHGTRKAFASKGDDATLTRFVKMTADEKGPAKRQKNRQPKLPGLEADWIREGRTKFGKSVKPHTAMPTILKSGHNNVKIGRDVRKGRLKGYWIYVLSLEERKTCPSSCQHWQTCYGNNMPYATRVDHTAVGFLEALSAEIRRLCRSRKGILIRLHALGDFYSPNYVDFWRAQLMAHKNLAIFGYTARMPDTRIGYEIALLMKHHPSQVFMRYSNGGMSRDSTVTIAGEHARPANAFICPEQTAKSACCATCGACWATNKNVAFIEH